MTGRGRKKTAFLLLYIFVFSLCIACAEAPEAVTVGAFSDADAVDRLRENMQTYDLGATENRRVGEAETITEYIDGRGYALALPRIGHAVIDEAISAQVDAIRAAFDLLYTGDSDAASAVLYVGYESYLWNERILSVVLLESHEQGGAQVGNTAVHALHFDMETGEALTDAALLTDDTAAIFAAAVSARATDTAFPAEEWAQMLAAADGGLAYALAEEGLILFGRGMTPVEGNAVPKLLLTHEEVAAALLPAPQAEPDTALPRVVDPEKPMVALTYDDGPHPEYGHQILDILEHYGVPATFFDLGSLIDCYPEVPLRALSLGCVVGSHSYNHKNLAKLSYDALRADLKKTNDIFVEKLGQPVSLLRVPYGSANSTVKSTVGLPIIGWSLDPRDWKDRDALKILAAVQEQGDLNGKVILLHSIYESTVEATTLLVPYLLNEGYQIVTIPELFAHYHGEEPQPGRIYAFEYFESHTK